MRLQQCEIGLLKVRGEVSSRSNPTSLGVFALVKKARGGRNPMEATAGGPHEKIFLIHLRKLKEDVARPGFVSLEVFLVGRHF